MDSYDEEVRRWQAANEADLRRLLAEDQGCEDGELLAARQQVAMQLCLARLRRKLSQDELSARTGMPQAHISRIESGKGNPSLNTLLRIARALDVNVVIK